MHAGAPNHSAPDVRIHVTTRPLPHVEADAVHGPRVLNRARTATTASEPHDSVACPISGCLPIRKLRLHPVSLAIHRRSCQRKRKLRGGEHLRTGDERTQQLRRRLSPTQSTSLRAAFHRQRRSAVRKINTLTALACTNAEDSTKVFAQQATPTMLLPALVRLRRRLLPPPLRPTHGAPEHTHATLAHKGAAFIPHHLFRSPCLPLSAPSSAASSPSAPPRSLRHPTVEFPARAPAIRAHRPTPPTISFSFALHFPADPSPPHPQLKPAVLAVRDVAARDLRQPPTPTTTAFARIIRRTEREINPYSKYPDVRAGENKWEMGLPAIVNGINNGISSGITIGNPGMIGILVPIATPKWLAAFSCVPSTAARCNDSYNARRMSSLQPFFPSVNGLAEIVPVKD
ncbi:hypothetical protein DFH06DRAFT_1141721 [Mycena polygramma]|nr:hypothetical protein DFH06DRAFT_1141721 [Mycena polygramma]